MKNHEESEIRNKRCECSNEWVVGGGGKESIGSRVVEECTRVKCAIRPSLQEKRGPNRDGVKRHLSMIHDSLTSLLRLHCIYCDIAVPKVFSISKKHQS